MKKRKIKLLASVASFAMVAAVAVTGVLAASQATAAINGSVSYQASGNVVSTITVTNLNTKTEGLTGNTATLSGNEAKDAAATGSPITLSAIDADSMTLATVEGTESEDIVWFYTFTVTNGAAAGVTNPDLEVTVNLNVTDKVTTLDTAHYQIALYASDKTNATGAGANAQTVKIVQGGDAATFTVVLTVDPQYSLPGEQNNVDVGVSLSLKAVPQATV